MDHHVEEGLVVSVLILQRFNGLVQLINQGSTLALISVGEIFKLRPKERLPGDSTFQLRLDLRSLH